MLKSNTILINSESLYRFIIEPKNGDQYINEIQTSTGGLIVNSSIEFANDIQRIGVVKKVPSFFKGVIIEGDELVVQHNVFRITYNDKGIPLESLHHIQDNLFWVTPDLVYMVIRNGVKMAFLDNVFLEPYFYEDEWEGIKELENVGTLKYINDELRKQGVSEGDLVCFRKNCQYEFNILGERLYVMKNKRILAKLNPN